MTSTLRPPSATPARLTASATLALPRRVLYALCLVYIFAGLIGRDPWKTEDATGFGVMWTMAQGTLADWLMPNVAGAPMVDDGPLMFWVGALAIQLLAPLIDGAHAARLANVVFFLIGARAIWYATYLLGRRPEAQPLALAFGGQPEARDYGRTLADAALLVLLGTLGLLTRIHESSTDVAMLAMLCVTLYAMARSLDTPRSGALWLAAGLIGLGYSAGVVVTGAVLLAWLVLLIVQSDLRAARLPFLGITLPLALVGLALWPLLTWLTLPEASGFFEARAALRQAQSSGATPGGLNSLVRTVPWFAWIAWPLAAWGAWSWRRQARTAHIAIPVALLGAALLVLLAAPRPDEQDLLTLIPGLVVLAAFGVPTMKRGAANGIDWFSLMIYSGAALLIWLGWLALMTGWPPRIAANFARQIPGFEAPFNPLAVTVALAATLTWVLLVTWRLTRHPQVLWRSVVLSGAGLTLSWLLLMTLWMPAINASKTYRDVALRLDAAAPDRACIRTDNLGLAQRASFAWFAGVQFSPIGLDGSQRNCPWLLRQDHARARQNNPPAAPAGSRWVLVWEGQRASDRDERFRLYRRVALPAASATGAAQ